MDPSDNSLADKCSTRLTDAPEIPQSPAATVAAPPRTRWQWFWRVIAAAFSGPSGGGPQ
jgi:hypothetical protein